MANPNPRTVVIKHGNLSESMDRMAITAIDAHLSSKEKRDNCFARRRGRQEVLAWQRRFDSIRNTIFAAAQIRQIAYSYLMETYFRQRCAALQHEETRHVDG